MKYSRLLFPIVFLFCTTHTEQLTHAVIDAKAEYIETKMKRDRYCFYGLTALSIAYHVGQSYQVGKIAFTNNSPAHNSPADQSAEKISMFQAFKDACSRTPQAFKDACWHMPQAFKDACWHLVCTQAGWTATAHVFVGIGSSIIISKLCEKLAHPDTLRWYIHSYAPYHVTIKMIKERLIELQDTSLDVHQLKICNELISLLYESLVRQGLSICAYVTYKGKYLDEEEKVIAERLKIFMIDSQNKWFDRLAAQFAADNRDYHAITKLIAAYEADIAAQINHFSIVEGETMHDRSMLKSKKEVRSDKPNKTN